MTLNILVSFSLLALVVSARPLPDASASHPKSLEVQNAIQAIFASRTGQRPEFWVNEDDDVHISLTSSEEQSALLSALRDEDIAAVKALIPLDLDGTPSEDEKQLYDILKGLQNESTAGSSLLDLDGGERPLPDSPSASEAPIAEAPAADEPAVPEATEDYLSVTLDALFTSPPAIVIAIACISAFLSLICIGAGLYALQHFQSFMLKHDLAWDILPRLERRVGLDGPDEIPVGSSPSPQQQPEKRRLLSGDALLPLPMLDSEKKPVEALDEKTASVDPPSGDDSNDDLDEKFEDAPEDHAHSLLFLESDHPPAYQPSVPRIVVDSSDHADPDLLPLPDVPPRSGRSTPFSTPLRTPLSSPPSSPAAGRRVPQMREATSPSKPLWSLRAADAPTLGLPTSGSPTSPAPAPTPAARTVSPAPQLPGALFPDDAPELQMVEVQPARPSTQGRTRTPRAPLDIAFALQLRPGLGLGADSAWIVRFLMAMFGWMTVLIGGGRQEAQRRALTA
ncbi:hypothetical protein PYCCODRAFT_1370877 [Trametes coccinea BRFM310]|uniref:Uncharacterized protein n=1 Tax=Trametes coccinea (strain BRFM310) TaxID=1353009 RepID=A0A1Y2IHG7_TRAC3|nr:hypothetical protein PYCCODRAFT_1370877 [Trametes coccinea BRFM310]